MPLTPLLKEETTLTRSKELRVGPNPASKCFLCTGCLGLPQSSPGQSSFFTEVTNQVSLWPGMALPLKRRTRATNCKNKVVVSPRPTRTPSTFPSVLLKARLVKVNFLCHQEGFSCSRTVQEDPGIQMPSPSAISARVAKLFSLG